MPVGQATASSTVSTPPQPPDRPSPDGAGGEPTDSPEQNVPAAEGGGGDAPPPEDQPSAAVPQPAGFRVAIYFVTVFMAVSWSLTLLLEAMGEPELVKLAQAAEMAIEPALALWLRLCALPIILLITVFFVRRVDRRPLASVGLAVPEGSGLHGLLACLLAAASLGGWWLLVSPWVESQLLAWSAEALLEDPWLPLGRVDLLELVVAFLGVAFLDELVFRGYVYSAFRERFPWVHAAGLANLLSVALYAGHPKIGAAGLINTFLLGMALAAMRERTGSLVMPSIFLGSWHALLACGLSLPAWGTVFPRLFDHHLSGAAELTGGEFGPVDSWLLTGVLVALVMALAWWVEAEVEVQEVED